jgi:ankyrin repeat protein
MKFLENCGFKSSDQYCAVENPNQETLKAHLTLVRKKLKAEEDGFGTQLHMAARNGKIDIVKSLLEQGASVNKKVLLEVDETTFTDATPLFCSVSSVQHEITHLLLKHGANPNVQVKTSLHGHFFISSPLFSACMTGDVASVKSLITAGADVNYKTKFLTMTDVTPLHVSCMTPISKTFSGLTIGRLLLENGADPDAIIIKTDEQRSGTVLHWIVVNSRSDLRWLNLLLQHKANANAKDDSGNTPLHLLAANDEIDANDSTIAQILIKYGADVKLLDSDGKTAVELAKESGNTSLYHELSKF